MGITVLPVGMAPPERREESAPLALKESVALLATSASKDHPETRAKFSTERHKALPANQVRSYLVPPAVNKQTVSGPIGARGKGGNGGR